MKKSILFLTGAAILLAGCAKVQNEEVLPEPEKTTQTVTLTASIGDNTRVSADAAGNYAWQVGEKIAVHVTGPEEDRIIPFTSTATEPTTTTNFTGEMSASEHLGQYAFYPLGIQDGGHSVASDGVMFGLWEDYMYVKDATNMPMLGTITSSGASFKAVGGLLKVIVYNVPEGTDVLQFTVNDEDAKITGGFLVTDDGEITLDSHDYGGGNTIYFYLWEENENQEFVRSLYEQNMVFYIPLPVGTYHSFTFSFNDICDENGNEISNPTSVTKSASMGGSGLQVHRNDIIVAPALNMAPPATTATLWSEDFGGYSSGNVPSGNVQKGYNGATVNYASAGSSTKIYEETNAGGVSPELLITSGGGSFTVSGIPTAGATSATLTFKENYSRTSVSTTTTGVTIGTGTFSNNVYTCTITIASGIDSFDLVFSNSNSKNVRVDNFVLEASIGAPVAAPIISTQGESATIAADNLSASINGVKITNPLDDQGIVATTDADWLNLSFEGSQSFEVGRKLVATATDHNYNAEERTATVTLSATGASKTVTIKQTSSLIPNPTLTAIPGNGTFSVTWTGHDKAASYEAYFSTYSNLSDPTTGTEMKVDYEDDAYTATLKEEVTVTNGTTYYVYVRIKELDDSASAYHIAEGWSATEVTPTAVTDYATTYTSNIELKTTGTQVTAVKVKINDNQYDALKAGSNGTAGDITNLTIPANTTHLHIHAAGWNGETVKVKITTGNTTITTITLTSDAGISGSSPFTLSGTLSDYYFDIPLSGMTTDKTFKFTVTSGKRFLLWGVNAE